MSEQDIWEHRFGNYKKALKSWVRPCCSMPNIRLGDSKSRDWKIDYVGLTGSSFGGVIVGLSLITWNPLNSKLFPCFLVNFAPSISRNRFKFRPSRIFASEAREIKSKKVLLGNYRIGTML